MPPRTKNAMQQKQREAIKSGKPPPAVIHTAKVAEQKLEKTDEAAGQNKVPKRKWVFDDTTARYNPPGHDVAVPEGWIPGNFSNTDDHKKLKPSDHEAKIRAAAMQIAYAPGKNLMMTCFMMWMSGNTIQIFSIMTLCMGLWGPLSKIANTQKEFTRFSESKIDLTLAKLVFIVLNFVGIGVAMYKASTLGLLPTPTDWLSAAVRPAQEYSTGYII